MKIAALVLVFVLTFSSVFATCEPCVGVLPTLTLGSTVDPSDYERLFDVNVVYAYAQQGIHFATVVLNYTRIPNKTYPTTSGITEIYKAEVYSNSDSIPTRGAADLIIGQPPLPDDLMALTWGLGSIAPGQHDAGLVSFEASYNINNYSLVTPVSIKLVMLGWVLSDGNLADLSLWRNETVGTVVLEEYGDGFLYNTLLPPGNLSQIDLFHPTKFNPTALPPSQSTPSPSPSPTQEPVSSEFTPAFLSVVVVGSVVSIVIACVAVLIYFRKRHFQPKVATQHNHPQTAQ